MNITASEELSNILKLLEFRINYLENSSNRAFELIEYTTLNFFHDYNLSLKEFWDNFDRHAAIQLFQFYKISNLHSELSSKYVKLLRNQISYLGRVINFSEKRVKGLSKVLFCQDGSKDVVSFYKECCKDALDDEGKELYYINIDKDYHSEEIDGVEVPIDFYRFCSDKIYDVHYEGFVTMHKSLCSMLDLVETVCSYPQELTYGYELSEEEIIIALDRGSRQYATEIRSNVERELKRTAQYKKSSRHAQLTPDIWGRVLDEEDDIYRLAISGHLEENEEKRFDNILKEQRKLYTDNAPLLQKILNTAIDGELFDIRLSVETHNLLTSLNVDNLDLFYELILRRNIIQREIYSERLGPVYEEWVNPPEERHLNENEDGELSTARQSKLEEIISILKRGNWKQPVTTDNVEQLLNTVFGKDKSLLDEGDIDKCEEMWSLVEGGSGERMVIVPANLAGFFSEENLLAGSPKEISTALFSNGNHVNNINKGNSNRCSVAFSSVIPFLKKYIDKIIRQV